MASKRPIASKRPTAPAASSMTPAVYHILLALGDGDRHGYAILRTIAADADAPTVGPTTLYRSLRQMLADGFIEVADERPDPALDNERRAYYRLTARGREGARARGRADGDGAHRPHRRRGAGQAPADGTMAMAGGHPSRQHIIRAPPPHSHPRMTRFLRHPGRPARRCGLPLCGGAGYHCARAARPRSSLCLA